MKKYACLLVVCCLSLSCFAKDDEPVGRINSVNEQSGENKRGEDVEILKINTIQSGKQFEGVMRVSMKLVGKNGKVAWGRAEVSHATGQARSGEYKGMSSIGAVNWTCEAGNRELKRPKLKAYTVEYGYMRGGEFIVLDSEYDKADSFEELAEQNKDSLPLKLKLDYVWWVQE